MATDRLTIEVEANTSGVDRLNASLKKLNNQLNRTTTTGDNADTGFKKITRAVNGFSRSLERIDITPIERLANALEKISTFRFSGTTKSLGKAIDSANSVNVSTGQEGLPSPEMDTSGIERVNSALDRLGKVSVIAKASLHGLGVGFGYLKKGINKVFAPLERLGALIKRRTLSFLIFRGMRLIMGAMSEGITNLYNYSKAWDNVDWTKAQRNMDDLATTSQTLKNTFGVTLMSVLVAIKPIIDAIADAFIRAANAINAFMAAISGSGTFTKATKQAKAFGEETTKAAKAAKNATAGIDELNILDPNSGSGGGGKATPDYSTMFEEVEVPSKIKDIVDWLRDNLDLIRLLALEIGAAFLAWKILSIIPSTVLDLIGKLGLLLAIIGAVALGWGAIDAWMNGVNWKNTIAMVGGTIAIFVGLLAAFGPVVAAIGLLVAGIVMLVVGLHDWIKNGELSTQTFWLLEAAIVAIGVALGILLGWPVLIIAAIVGIALACYKYWDEIKAKFSQFTEFLSTKFSSFKASFLNMISAIKSKAVSIVTSMKQSILNIVTAVITTITSKTTSFKTTFLNIFTSIKSGIKTIINDILGFFEAMVNGVINGLNKMISALNSLSIDVPDWVPEIGGGKFGFNISPINTITIPKLASGGMVEAGQLFIANEAGAEMVGSMGGNTTVANNEQIISGIQQGVEVAVSQILAPYLSQIAENTRETANKDFSVNIGDRDIARANIRGQRSIGRTIITTV